MCVCVLVTWQDRVSPVMSLMVERRARQEDVLYMDDGRVMMKYTMPWAEVVTDFFDTLKSISAGNNSTRIALNALCC